MSCTVCNEAGLEQVGGVLLFERSGTVSAICPNCWEQFSTASPKERQIKNKAQYTAQEKNIGIETQLFHKFLPQSKSFHDNVDEAREKYLYQIQESPVCDC